MPVRLHNLFWSFLKIGCTAFGGFMALVAIVEREMVHGKKAISSERMLDGISLAAILPGPVAVNLVAFVGYELKGIRGALVSMMAVILPSFLLVYSLSVFYFNYGELPVIEKFFNGILPAVSAIIVSVAIGLSRNHIKGYQQVIIGLSAALLVYFVGGFYLTLAIIMVSAVIGIILFRDDEVENKSAEVISGIQFNKREWINFALFCGLVITAYVILWKAIPENGAWYDAKKMLFVFSGISFSLFGGGYVFIPVIQELVVQKLNLMTIKEFADGIALGQVTPGPIMISAAFIGYKAAGFWGALMGTIGIFLPSGMIMIFASLGFKHVSSMPVVKRIFQGVRPAVIGMIFAAALIIAQSVEWKGLSYLIFLTTLLVIIKFKVNVFWVIPLSGLLWYIAA